MNRSRAASRDVIGRTTLEQQRRLVLAVVAGQDGGALTGPAILRRLGEQSADGPADDGGAVTNESLLYPALHGLEADWTIRAEWQVGSDGVRHRSYRARRLLPRIAGRGRPT
jgi:DNA-binding PadR family transcriptional regulator